MTIKAFAFSAQRRIAERLGISLQRSHIYESIAAACGFASYASLCADSVLDVGSPRRPSETQTTDRVVQRLRQLGITDAPAHQVGPELAAIVHEHGLHAVRIDRVIDDLSPECLADGIQDGDEEHALEDVDDAPEDGPIHLFDGGDVSEFLFAGLEEAARRGNPKAHYALSLVLLPDEEPPAGGSYWHDRQAEGVQLSGVQLEWANAHRDAKQQEQARWHHLREAARLGYPSACVDAADEFQDASFLTMIDATELRDPARASDIAAQLGQTALAKIWCATAARAGDVAAIRRMVDDFDRADLVRCWTWVHFARLLGTDLTRDEYRLVNEDGSDYDDDIGGPGYPVGSEGVELPLLDEIQDSLARTEAAVMAARCMQSAGKKKPPERVA